MWDIMDKWEGCKDRAQDLRKFHPHPIAWFWSPTVLIGRHKVILTDHRFIVWPKGLTCPPSSNSPKHISVKFLKLHCETLVALWLRWSWEVICIKLLFGVLNSWVAGQIYLEWLSYWLSMFSSGSFLGGRYIAPGLAQTCQFNLGDTSISTLGTVTTCCRWTVTGSDMSIQFDPKLPPAMLNLLHTFLLFNSPWNYTLVYTVYCLLQVFASCLDKFACPRR